MSHLPSVPPTRYAIVGASSRAFMYGNALTGPYRDRHRLVAICDHNRTRMQAHARAYAGRGLVDLPMYAPEEFERMLREQQVQCVIVTSVDRTHHDYIIRALEAGCDAVTEKPMTIDAEKCRAVLAAVQRTGRRLRVCFNYRYAPHNTKVKEVLASGAIGEVLSVHFEWLLDTRHGADYFRRWHRDIRNSGGLLVHKATHHFDLMNWWLDDRPATVMAMGDLRFYGRANADARGWGHRWDNADHANAAGDPWACDLKSDPWMKEFYHQAAQEDGYRRDQNPFGDGISIQDDLALMVRYRRKAVMTYHLSAYSPWEGWRVMFNGSGGRLEYVYEENTHLGTGDIDPRLASFGAECLASHGAVRDIMLRPLWKPPLRIPIPQAEGGHGGGDERLLHDLFVGGGDNALGHAADHEAGAWSILTGIAGNRSLATGLPVACAGLLHEDA